MPLGLDKRRATVYGTAHAISRLTDGVLRKVESDGRTRVVPRPEQRINLIRHATRTLVTMARRKHTPCWSRLIGGAVCLTRLSMKSPHAPCATALRPPSRSRTPSCNHSLSWDYLYRWGCDTCKMPVKSDNGYRRVLTMVEHFSKWVELAPLPSKDPKYTAAALRDVLTRFGAPAEIVTDQGSEFQGEFATLLEQLMIDHRETSRNHPQADGLSERIVGVTKKGLKTYCLTYDKHHWDQFLPWIAMGYRMSRHASLVGYSPYYLLFGRHPIVGSPLREILARPIELNLDSPEHTAKVLRERALKFQEAMPIAFNNLLIAQHRDILRYAHTRSGHYKPKLRRYAVGDLVYIRRKQADSLDPKVGRIILRVKKVLGSGRLILEGRDQKTIKEHVENCAPCHNPNIDLWQNPALAAGDLDQACQVCHKASGGRHMLLCDNCAEGWHMYCLTPPLARIPRGDWFCPRCVEDDPS